MAKTMLKPSTQRKLQRWSPLTPAEKLEIAHSARGTWKRPLKQTLRTLAKIRKGLDRRIG